MEKDIMNNSLKKILEIVQKMGWEAVMENLQINASKDDAHISIHFSEIPEEQIVNTPTGNVKIKRPDKNNAQIQFFVSRDNNKISNEFNFGNKLDLARFQQVLFNLDPKKL